MKKNIKIWFVVCTFLIFHQASGFVPNVVIGTIGGMQFNNLQGIAFTPDNSKVYICNYNENNIFIIDVISNTFIGNVYDPNGYIHNPQSIAITSDGTTAYVCSHNGLPGNLGGVTIIDLTTNTATQLVLDIPNSLSFNHPFGIAITPDGLYGYVTNQNGGISIIDCNPANLTTYNTVINKVADPQNLLRNPTAIAITPYSIGGIYYAYVINSGNTTITLVQLGAGVGQTIQNVKNSNLFNGLTSIAFSPNHLNSVYYAYATNSGNNSVSRINLTTNSTDITISDVNIKNPDCIAIDSTGTYAYVANSGSNGGISVITLSDYSVEQISNTSTNSSVFCALSPNGQYLFYVDDSVNPNMVVKLTISTNQVLDVEASFISMNAPQAIAITPDGTTGYVGNTSGGQEGTGYISVFDIPSNILTGLINDPNNLLNPFAIAITSDGTTAYVADYNLNNVGVVDLSTNDVINSIPDISLPTCLALTLDGSKLYVGNTNDIAVIDTTTNTISSSIDNTSGTISIAMRPGTTQAYVVYNTGEGGYAVGVVDTTEDTIITTSINDPQSLLTQPSYIAISPDGTTGYVTNINTNLPKINDNPYQVVIIDLVSNPVTTTGIVTDSANTFNNPLAIVFSPNGLAAYVTNAGPNQNTNPYSYAVSIIDIALGKVSGTITSPSLQTPYAMAITPNGTIGYVVNNSGNSVSIVSILEPTRVLIEAPATITVKTKLNNFLQYSDIVNLISWTVPSSGPVPAAYKIYRDAGLTNLITTVDASNPLLHVDRHLQPNTSYSYYIVSVDSLGNFSESIMTTVLT